MQSILLRLAALVSVFLFTAATGTPPRAQDEPLTFATVERVPFSHQMGDAHTGFSIDLMRAIATEIGRDVSFTRVEKFADMFDAVQAGRVDGAIANISITSTREEIMDFSQPIFEAGLQIMIPADASGGSLLSALFSRDILLAILAAGALLFAGGMAMWAFERHRQPYFDRPARSALFPSFWWALNLVVNGGFEERVPQSRPGRVFAVLLVISSLFIVSIFVARITAAMTVEAITSNIETLSDLDGRHIATIEGSTASAFLDSRGIHHARAASLQELLDGFEAGHLDAVVFDGPILAHHLRIHPESGRLLPRVFKRENYGIALPTDSPLTEEINRALLSLRESGRYSELRAQYFGAQP
ncbi:transporter substrate-binding domain-containing protein [Marimonas lutisalis]|uniref:transporter substrate-binding domain-containing protein n=1 Tax=Marimonas lutisalis TaxID=2545756 RepID=UPI0010F6D004|nr:transporter substrate-binding domain-containing protein [Marimonas lutisalis]